MPESLQEFISSPLARRLIVLVIGLLIIFVIRRVVNRSLNSHLSSNSTKYRTRKGITFVAYMLAILFASIVFSDNLGGLTLTFGVAGAGIAFALQEVIVSIAGWIAISFGNYYKVGDRISMGGIKGDVVDISVLRTTLFELGGWIDGDLYNGRVVRIANSFLFREPVYNYSGDFPFLWDEITVPIRYGSDVDVTRRMMLSIAERLLGDYSSEASIEWKTMTNKYLVEQASVEPRVTITADENWITFTLRYVVDYKNRRSSKDKLYSMILEEIAASNGKISIASASQELLFMPGSEILVRDSSRSK